MRDLEVETELSRVMVLASPMLVPRVMMSPQRLLALASTAQVRKVRTHAGVAIVVVTDTSGRRCSLLALTILNRALRLCPPSATEIQMDALLHLWSPPPTS